MSNKIQLLENSKNGDFGDNLNISELEWQLVRSLPQLEWFSVELELQLA
jgi:hypothetical protein